MAGPHSEQDSFQALEILAPSVRLRSGDRSERVNGDAEVGGGFDEAAVEGADCGAVGGADGEMEGVAGAEAEMVGGGEGAEMGWGYKPARLLVVPPAPRIGRFRPDADTIEIFV